MRIVRSRQSGGKLLSAGTPIDTHRLGNRLTACNLLLFLPLCQQQSPLILCNTPFAIGKNRKITGENQEKTMMSK
jgi:hypothetical protein